MNVAQMRDVQAEGQILKLDEQQSLSYLDVVFLVLWSVSNGDLYDQLQQLILCVMMIPFWGEDVYWHMFPSNMTWPPSTHQN